MPPREEKVKPAEADKNLASAEKGTNVVDTTSGEGQVNQEELDKIAAEQEAAAERSAALRAALEEEEELTTRLAKAREENKLASEQMANAESGKVKEVGTVGLKEKKVHLVKVRFTKPHTFTIGGETFHAVAGSMFMVEMHLANKLANRQLAFMMSN